MSNPYRKLTPEELDAFGAELDAIRQRVIADLGEADAEYLRKVVKAQRGLEVAGRVMFYLPPLWPVAVASLGVSKILDNMEIGHNVMHGQYDWLGDPGLNSGKFEWDTMAPSENWKHSHNYIHHTYTNILGKDRDVGYGILRMDEDQEWRPYYLGNPLYALGLMLLFEWGVALHDLETETMNLANEIAQMHPFALAMAKRAVNQTLDIMGQYVAQQSVFDMHSLAHGNALSLTGYPVLANLDEMKSAQKDKSSQDK